MIWCIHKSRPMEDHKSCRRWCFVPLHFGLQALIRNECERRFALKFCATSEKSLMSCTPGHNLPKCQTHLLLLFLLSRSSNLFHRLMMQVWTLGATITGKWWHGSTGSMISNPGAEASNLG